MKVTIATPFYGGLANLDYLIAMLRLQQLCRERNIDLIFDFIANESLITRARNTLVENFLRSNDKSDVLFFIDSDIGFDANQIIECVESGLPVCGISYPLKGYSDKMMRERLELEVGKRPIPDIQKSLLTCSLPANINLLIEKQEGGQVSVSCNLNRGFLEVSKIGTGLMCIRREVLEKMIETHPETYRNDVGGYSGEYEYHTLFDTMIEPDTKRYLSEDYAFCHKWRALGGKIWVHINSVAYHTGYHRFQGSLLESLPREMREHIINFYAEMKNKAVEPTPTDSEPKFTKRKKEKEPAE